MTATADIERAIGVTPIETVSIHPLRPLYEACRKMLESRARRIPLVDVDDETHREMVVSVVTQYRILKFVAVNVKDTEKLRKPLRDLNMGTYMNLATAHMDTPVMDCIHMLVKKSISSVPILDNDGTAVSFHYLATVLIRPGTVLNVFEAVDVIMLIKGGVYEDLNLTVGEALKKRPDVWHSVLRDLTSYGSNYRPRISQASTPARRTTGSIRFSTRSASHEYTGSWSLTRRTN